MSESPAYRVLARKYRPQRFSELIGQDAMVTTLGNAIRRGRLAHAFLMTGVRGVGKTSTARLIAKALNCVGPDGQGGPTIDPCGVCEPCVAIAEGRHIDVVEMDAASHTGVDDVREIIEAVRYSAVSARYKVYIIDEVHMLSKNAFNALLKTLEEPPAHVKFLFATTEVNKVPVTVLSRCQRFDLRRIPADKLAAHFAHVIDAEGAQAEAEALALIARAAEGSARDGLSILDQAIAHADMGGEGIVTADQVREMLGLSDRGAIRRLFGQLLAGEGAAALTALRDQYDLGVDPVGVLRGLLEAVHAVTMAKMGGGADPALSGEERELLDGWAARLSFAQLHRLWQLLLKGHEETVRAAMPIEAAEMALLRLVHAAELPDPSELLKRIAGGEPVAPAPARAPASAPPPAAPEPAAHYPESFPALVDLLGKSGKPLLAQQLHDFVGLQRYAPPELAVRPLKPLPGDFMRDLAAALRTLTGTVWTVGTDDGGAQPSLLEQERAVEETARQAILDTPLVKAAFEAFPDAELIDYSAAEQRSAP
ncbi:DNA polymerase III subunit gamma/tau [Sphingomonas sp. MAH-20]|uniref:DNA polymerase III subunit gamma/tau n=1 Tax=Sphingomonas horti TaxID=2682842 RepID=A0A6I4IYX5_9SPHN|nr:MULTISPECIES: DNA polymerase III subunit gamma/tau [Sphingomonas]MBA2920387.1 DNA polymerase III subunit gamma/tau [Sphingomonas sp. CGMCC 1.13658]MVO76641.1 DNA polymerase III subunit gamma/tau [Sphingomonas horti]